MDFEIISVGKVKDLLLCAKIDEYAKRIRHDARISFRRIKDAGIAREEKTITAAILKQQGHVIALAEEGPCRSSMEFAAHLRNAGRRIVFVIGGHEGLGPGVKQMADELLSLSRMTFTHEMAQLLLLEQLYRAIAINLGRTYHRQ